MLPILRYPDPVLNRRARAVPVDLEGVRGLVQGMLEAMHAASGIGLAVPQVGESLRLFVASESADPKDAIVCINPVVEPFGSPAQLEEGCLSLPGIRAIVTRPEKVRLSWTDLDGSPQSGEFDELWARIIQHEYDHLEGVLFIDRMTPTDRLRIKPDLLTLEEQYQPR